MNSNLSTVTEFLIETGLARIGDTITTEPLVGGVSSDIWRVTLPGRVLCVKRALPELRVASHWEAPVSRNTSEWDWLKHVATILPSAVPTLLAHDPKAAMIAMEYLDPEVFPVWKSLLRDGTISIEFAAKVGRQLSAIHAATAENDELAAKFATDSTFWALRLKPYFVDTAIRHVELREELNDLAASTAKTKRTLVHGDISPKNILVGPAGPVFLDAECAWFGDPAFDIAFVLNHLLLKCAWRPQYSDRYVDAFRALTSAYFLNVDWEPVGELEARCARLLPALLLGRVDGTSPVEYLTDEHDRESVRRLAIRMILDRPQTLHEIVRTWAPQFVTSSYTI